MSTAEKRPLISVEDYLNGELTANRKHEYVAGIVYAMVGGTNAHQLIASNILGELYLQLVDGRCQALNSDTKIRIRQFHQTRFYYPDVSVVCRPNPLSETFHDQPVIVFEVISKSTRRIDEGEKRDSYLSIPSLATYILLEQDSPTAIVYRRSDQGFEREVYEGLNEVIDLPEIKSILRLAAVFAGVDFVPEFDTPD